jgi:hypothetical protein
MTRVCAYCGAPLPENARKDKKVCSDSHRTLFNRWRQRRNDIIGVQKAWVQNYAKEADTPQKKQHTLQHLQNLRDAIDAVIMESYLVSENDEKRKSNGQH